MGINHELIKKKLLDLDETINRIERMDVTMDMITGDEDVQDLLN